MTVQRGNLRQLTKMSRVCHECEQKYVQDKPFHGREVRTVDVDFKNGFPLLYQLENSVSYLGSGTQPLLFLQKNP